MDSKCLKHETSSSSELCSTEGASNFLKQVETNLHGIKSSLDNIHNSVNSKASQSAEALYSLNSFLESTYTAQFQELTAAINKIADKPWHEHPVILMIFSALLAALFAYFFNRIHWKKTNQSTNFVTLGELIIDLLGSLEGDLRQSNPSQKIQDTASRLVKKHHYLRKLLEVFSESPCLKTKITFDKAVDPVVRDLFEVLTGDEIYEDTEDLSRTLSRVVDLSYIIRTEVVSRIYAI